MIIAFHKHNLELMVATWLFPSYGDDLENFSLVDVERGSLVSSLAVLKRERVCMCQAVRNGSILAPLAHCFGIAGTRLPASRVL